MSTVTPSRTSSRPSGSPVVRRAPLYLQIAAWSVPVLLLGQFAMIALVPVLIVVIGGFTDPRSRYLRWWGAAVGAAYAIPLAIFTFRDDPAKSLSQDMHPIALAVVVAAAAALLVRLYVGARRRS
jgi:hypothetical protein